VLQECASIRSANFRRVADWGLHGPCWGQREQQKTRTAEPTSVITAAGLASEKRRVPL
jgi:hypothetical protein